MEDGLIMLENFIKKATAMSDLLARIVTGCLKGCFEKSTGCFILLKIIKVCVATKPNHALNKRFTAQTFSL